MRELGAPSKRSGRTITAVGVDEEGIQLSKLRSARLIYVTPAHQFPLGITMSLPRRLALLEKARQNNSLIFEDDYDSEFRYSGRPVPALQASIATDAFSLPAASVR